MKDKTCPSMLHYHPAQRGLIDRALIVLWEKQHCLSDLRHEPLNALQARDLHEWEESPESFHHEADVGSWEDHLRSCAETLFAALLEVRSPCRPTCSKTCPLVSLFSC